MRYKLVDIVEQYLAFISKKPQNNNFINIAIIVVTAGMTRKHVCVPRTHLSLSSYSYKAILVISDNQSRITIT